MKRFSLVFAAALAAAAPAAAQEHHQHHAPVQPPSAAPQPAPPAHEHAAPQPQAPAAHEMSMTGALGPYTMGREASGTSWQPDVSQHGGMHIHTDGWMFMSHVMLNGVYDWQDGPRGDEKTFLAGMIMGSARRDIGAAGTLNLRAMLSPDPFMGKAGYPLLFAQGETANGVTPLIDRQHPHDLFMELSASYAHRLSDASSVYVYAGLPGEPAFGPPAFMHRLSAMDSPEAPITHHWLDSTHITFGVLTAGYVRGDWKIEASRFRGREPNEERYDIETGDFDSTAARVSWNPTRALSLQVSWADVTSPEQLHPDDDETRWSASAIYTREFGEKGWWSTTAAFGRKRGHDGDADAWVLETALHPNETWTVFGRAERIETEELAPGGLETVARLSLGAIRDWRVAEHVVFGVGAMAQRHLAADALEPAYDGDPNGAMAFVRLKVG